jgi:hypothetical protein
MCDVGHSQILKFKRSLLNLRSSRSKTNKHTICGYKSVDGAYVDRSIKHPLFVFVFCVVAIESIPASLPSTMKTAILSLLLASASAFAPATTVRPICAGQLRRANKLFFYCIDPIEIATLTRHSNCVTATAV